MSAETKAALDAAIQAHIADSSQSDSVVTGYALIVAHANMSDFDQDQTRYYVEYAERQPFYAALGLVRQHSLQIEDQFRRGL